LSPEVLRIVTGFFLKSGGKRSIKPEGTEENTKNTAILTFGGGEHKLEIEIFLCPQSMNKKQNAVRRRFRSNSGGQPPRLER